MDSSVSLGSSPDAIDSEGYPSDYSSEYQLDINPQYQTINIALHNDHIRDRFRRVAEAIAPEQMDTLFLELAQSGIAERGGVTQAAAFSALEDSLENRASILNRENLVFADQPRIKGLDAKSWFLSSAAALSPHEQGTHHRAIVNSKILDCDDETQWRCFEVLAKAPDYRESILHEDTLDLAERLKGNDAKYWFFESKAAIAREPEQQGAFGQAVKNSRIFDHDDVTQAAVFEALVDFPEQREYLLNEDTLALTAQIKGDHAKYWFLRSVAAIPQEPKEQAELRDDVQRSTILRYDDEMQAKWFEALATSPPAAREPLLDRENLIFADQSMRPFDRGIDVAYGFLKSTTFFSPDEQALYRDEIRPSAILDRGITAVTKVEAFHAITKYPEHFRYIIDEDNLGFAQQLKTPHAQSRFFKSAATIPQEPREERAEFHNELTESEILHHDGDIQAFAFEVTAQYPNRHGSVLNKETLDFAEQLETPDAQVWFFNAAAVIPQEHEAGFHNELAESEILGRGGAIQTAAFQLTTTYPKQHGSLLKKDNLDFADQLEGSDTKYWFLSSVAATSPEPAIFRRNDETQAAASEVASLSSVATPSPETEQPATFREVVLNSRILSCHSVTQAEAFQVIAEQPKRFKSILNKENLDIADKLKTPDATYWFFQNVAERSHISGRQARYHEAMREQLPDRQARFRETIDDSNILSCDGATQNAAFQAAAEFPPKHESILNRDNVAFAAQLKGLDAMSRFFESMPTSSRKRVQDAFTKDVRRSTILDRDGVTQAAVFQALEHSPENREFILHESTLNLVEQLKTPDAKSRFYECTEAFTEKQPAEFREAVRDSTILVRDGVMQESALKALEKFPEHRESILHKNTLDFAEKLKTPNAQNWFFKNVGAISQEPERQAEFHNELVESGILGRKGDTQEAAFIALRDSPKQRESILKKENLDFAERFIKGSSAMHRFLSCVAAISPEPEPQSKFREDVGHSTILKYDVEMQAAVFEALKTSPAQREPILKIKKENLDFAERFIEGRPAKAWFVKSVVALPQAQQPGFCEKIKTSTILDHGDAMQAEAFEVTAQYPKQHGLILDSVAFGARLRGGFKNFLKSTAAISHEPNEPAAFHDVIEKSKILERTYLLADAFEVTAQYPKQYGSILDRDNLVFGAQFRDAFKGFLKSTAAISQEPNEQAQFRRELDESDIWDRNHVTQEQAFQDIETSPENRNDVLIRINQPVPIRTGTKKKYLKTLSKTKYPSAFFSAGPSSRQNREDGPPQRALGFSEFVLDRIDDQRVPKNIRVKPKKKHNVKGRYDSQESLEIISNAYTLTDDSDKTKNKTKMDIKLDHFGNLDLVLRECAEDADQYWHLSRTANKDWHAERTDLVRPNKMKRAWEALRGASSTDKGKGKAREGRS